MQVESPTGTGKSLTLLTSTLTWLAENKTRLDKATEENLRAQLAAEDPDGRHHHGWSQHVPEALSADSCGRQKMYGSLTLRSSMGCRARPPSQTHRAARYRRSSTRATRRCSGKGKAAAASIGIESWTVGWAGTWCQAT